jgi:hypothetical protein
VVIHGFFNEGPSNDPNACVGYAASAQRIRELSGTPARVLVTWANNHGASDACIEYEDVYSRNAYPGVSSAPPRLWCLPHEHCAQW